MPSILDNSATAYPVFYRSYSRFVDGSRESWSEVCNRTIKALKQLGDLNQDQADLILKMQTQLKTLPSGRWLWVGGTDWNSRQENFPGAYNCTSTEVVDWKSFGLMMDLAMMGCGTGAILENRCISQLPVIVNKLNVTVVRDIGETHQTDRIEKTEVAKTDDEIVIVVGDSRQGWVDSYRDLLELSSFHDIPGQEIDVFIDLGSVRPPGERLKGFGGTSNPIRLTDLYSRVAKILNNAQGRKLTPIECCLLIDEAALCVVAGNIRRSAGMRQFDSWDLEAAKAKENLWKLDLDGNWRIDPDKDALRMANHTRVFHQKPDYDTVKDAVTKQYYSGEGAIQYAPEAIARANASILRNEVEKKEFIRLYTEKGADEALKYLSQLLGLPADPDRLDRYGLNPCVTGDTLVPVKNRGFMRIKDIADNISPVQIRDGNGNWVYSRARKTGENESLLLVELSDGSQYRVTPYHDFVLPDGSKVKAMDLQKGQILKNSDVNGVHGNIEDPKQAYLDAWLIADGTKSGKNSSKLYLYEPKFDHREQLCAVGASFRDASSKTQNRKVAYFPEKQMPLKTHVPNYVLQGNARTKLAFIDGYLQSDGTESITPNGWCVQISSIHRSILQDIQAILRTFDVYSSIGISHEAQTKSLPNHDGYGGKSEYFCKTIYRLTITNPTKLFEYLRPKRVVRGAYNKDRTISVKSVTPCDHTEDVYCFNVPTTHSFDLATAHSGNCGEIIGKNFFCNLSEVHLNQLDPENLDEQEDAFKAGALAVAALLNHEFKENRYAISRNQDPIVGVSFTGLFDFFVKAFGVPWLKWWEAGRPNTTEGHGFRHREREYLSWWKEIVHMTVWEYCDAHDIKCPNRCTTVQPAGSKSLLTGASSGWHPPKSQRFIRRITFGKDDPVAQACVDYGYSVVPSQSDKDENGNLLNDPNDPRCTAWLVEIPVEVCWANLPGADEIAIEKFSALAQFDFYMQVQRYYTTHNTSATIEMRESEIEPLAERIHKAIQEDEGYISAAILARFDDSQTYPRLPFEPIDKETYDHLMYQVQHRRINPDFHDALLGYDSADKMVEAGPAGCDSDKCLLPE